MKIHNNDIAEFKGRIIDTLEDFCDKCGITIDNPDKEEYDEEAGYEPGENAAIIFGNDYDTIADKADIFINSNDNSYTEKEIDDLIKCMMRNFFEILTERGHIIKVENDLKELITNWTKEEN